MIKKRYQRRPDRRRRPVVSGQGGKAIWHASLGNGSSWRTDFRRLPGVGCTHHDLIQPRDGVRVSFVLLLSFGIGATVVPVADQVDFMPMESTSSMVTAIDHRAGVEFQPASPEK